MEENTDWLINRENSIGNSKEIYVRGKKASKVMEEDIKILEELVEKSKDLREEDFYKLIGIKQIQTIATFIKVYKQKDKDNNDLRRLYRRTAEKLKENGKEELADYFLAQINEIPTFVVDDDIDYYTEYYKFRNAEIFSVKQLKYIEENQKKYFINKKVVEEKIEELDKEYKDILSDYGNIDTDVVINIPNANVRKHCDKLVEKIIVLQELLKGE